MMSLMLLNKLSCAQWYEHLFPNAAVFNTARDLTKFSLCDHFYLFARFPLLFSYIHLTPQSHHHHHNLSSVFSTNPSKYKLFTLLLLLLTTCSDLIVSIHILGSIESQPFIIELISCICPLVFFLQLCWLFLELFK